MAGLKRRKGFTLIELMVVITIIAIIASVAIVAINGALFTARKNACSLNMNNLYKALTAYALSNSGAFPVSQEFVALQGAAPSNGAVGANCLFGLFQDGHVENKHFLCPAQNHKSTDIKIRTSGSAAIMFDNNPQGRKFCDFAFDPNHRQDESTTGVVVLADRPPTAAEVKPGDVSVEAKNSPNHSRKGQNCLLLSGSVEFFENSACGVQKENTKDDIYTKNEALLNEDSYCIP